MYDNIDLCTPYYQVDPKNGETKNVERYEMLLEMIAAEETCRERVRESEEEVRKRGGRGQGGGVHCELNININPCPLAHAIL